MKKVLFIDRDGTILKEPPGDFQVDSLGKFEFMPGVIGALRKIVSRTDYRLVMVTNQDGLGTPSFPMDDFLPLQELMLRTLAGEGVIFDEVFIDSSFPADCSRFRKPGVGMVEKYLNENLDYAHSYVIGDRDTDMELAANMGIQGVFVGKCSGTGLSVGFSTVSWEQIADFILLENRKAKICRKTSETEIGMELDLNGRGNSDIKTGLAFFDHMLEQIARHGGVDLKVRADGDLKVDEHHTIEDVAIVLGECFFQALGSRKGIERYGFTLPMDEAKAEILLDFGGRSWLEWKVRFDREYVGDFPTEMTRHFFASFCQSAKCNLQISANGENTHHVIEAVFKAFGRTLRQAIRQTGTEIPSSKGIL